MQLAPYIYTLYSALCRQCLHAGFGCSFVYDDCLDVQSFPYTCSPTGSSRDWCSFDGVYKVNIIQGFPVKWSVTLLPNPNMQAVCQEHPATDGCRIPMPDTTVNADCRSPAANSKRQSVNLEMKSKL